MNKEAVSGATAGFVATITLHPLDVIKTRLQVQDLSKTYDGTVHAFKTILKREGARGLYAGLTPAVVGNTASWAMYFALYDRARKRYEKRGTSSRNGEGGGGGGGGRGVVGGGNDDDDDDDGASKKSISSGETLLAAAEAGIGVSLLTNPIWVAKTRLALQERGGGAEAAPKAGGAGVKVQKPTKATVRYKGLIDCLYSIARNEGVSGLYKGLTPSLLLVSHGAIQFTCYENLKSLARGGVISAASIGDSNGGGEMNNDVIDTTREQQQQQQLQQRELTSAECGVYGMLSKIVASLVTYPQQVVRARMQKLQIERNQIKYKTLLQSFATISRREGISGMYKGMVPNLARMLPSTGVTFFTYEFVNRMFENDESTDSG